MKIADLLAPVDIAIGEEIASKKKALEKLSLLLSINSGLEQDDIFAALVAREKLGSTGLGAGIAIPHCRIANCQKPCTALLVLNTPIDFEARDDQKVDILWALIVPEESTDEHLQILATLAEQLENKQHCSLLRSSSNATELYERLCAA